LAKSGRIVAGQTLRIPHRDALRFAQHVPDPSIERYGTAATRAGRAHVVKRGETLSGIAARYRVPVARLRALNRLRTTRIVAGQVLTIRR
jgi:LysM repeat protein